MSPSLLTVIPSGNRELCAHVETWKGLKDWVRVPVVEGFCTASPGDLSTRPFSPAFAGYTGPSGGFVAKALMPQAGLTSGVAEPSRLYFLKSKMPPDRIWFPQLGQRPYDACMCPSHQCQETVRQTSDPHLQVTKDCRVQLSHP